MIHVTVWNENVHEQLEERIHAIYPDGIHGALKQGLQDEQIQVTTATLDMPGCGLSDELLDQTDVLLWWGHMAHDKVPDELAAKVADRVRQGMGFIALHSAHMSKPFRLLMGTAGTLRWGDNVKEILWCLEPNHPIAKGCPPCILIPQEEVYGERFDIPTPDELVFASWFEGGSIFRSGCCWKRGYGKVFYFQPGHEEFPHYYNKDILRILKNAIIWAAPAQKRVGFDCPYQNPHPLEELQAGHTPAMI